MKFSYKDLSQYFSESLPSVEVVAEALIAQAFEVEEIVAKDNQDWELDIKILPDRAPDIKTSLDLARELSAVLDQPLKSEYQELPTTQTARLKISFTITDINNLLGVELSTEQIISYLKRVRVLVETRGEQLTALIPPERQDLNRHEDLADEVARLYGYANIPTRPLKASQDQIVHSSDFVLANQIRQHLLNDAYTEIYGYTFTNQGEIEVAKPLASDKAYLRTNLSEGMKKTIEFNLQNVLFETDEIKVFEIGSVFSGGQEELRVAVGRGVKKPKINVEIKENKLSDWQNQVSTTIANLADFIKPELTYQAFSVYPRIIRDIALFVAESEQAEMVTELIKTEAGSLLVAGPYLFDTFSKAGKKSLAFRLVFQAYDRTLFDEEINQIIEKIILALETKGWEVRK
ncbi:MAG: hypothetical protein COX02_02485 [Candidatus Vogelbacteria bacterium CG22_combo_CG10-13_8_21_14_all_37_9]|uniref:phenylalanine--tRNA ligase n=1 Tax=Candidatus Vogelbacteria bacterium CG22_combo_CG10-13_8_21_14_all_37_9 TaxID=1975046 RepID=A0A2H0BKA5_9BACT|nr:MAG: hypothetical protein BK005_00270 [bacterium CG10_37_50]PIP58024.1 MAG: hypothetical protein COX02_02485 [Candidatus Vogelbacteria bacterium CG22_combo_CG10-13_8_21_14_all_37_9]